MAPAAAPPSEPALSFVAPTPVAVPVATPAQPAPIAPPVPKAGPFARLVAQFIDGLIADMFLAPAAVLLSIELAARSAGNAGEDTQLLIAVALSVAGGVWSVWYWLTKDGWGRGQSFGKRLLGLATVRVDSGAPAGKGASAGRQIILTLLSGAGLWIVEAAMVLFRADGRRLGDLAAGTQVVPSAAVSGQGPKAGKGVAAAMLVFSLFFAGASSVWAIIVLPDALDDTSTNVTTTMPADTDDDSSSTSELNEDLEPRDTEPSGFATAEEALLDTMEAGWVYDVYTDEGSVIEFIVGPPNSEYVEVIVVAQQPDGSWLVEESYSYDIGEIDVPVSPEDEAALVVSDFIFAVQEDRADDAHALTISPFADDPASASFSNGDLAGFDITRVDVAGEGATVEVYVTEHWAYGDDAFIYTCVPTELGYRISELRPQ